MTGVQRQKNEVTLGSNSKEGGGGGLKFNVRVKSHSRCCLEPQAHSAAPSSLCIPAPPAEGADPGDLEEAALQGEGQRSEVKGHPRTTPSFHPLPLTESLGLHHLGATAAAGQTGSAARSRGVSPAPERAEVEATSVTHPRRGRRRALRRGRPEPGGDGRAEVSSPGPPWLPRSPPLATSSL